ncbi:acylphosphatase [Planctomycetota bacterium]
MIRQRIIITGRVQGVGFRPAVYRIAVQLGLGWFVYSDIKGAMTELGLIARSHNKICKVARTIADLADTEQIFRRTHRRSYQLS